MASARFVLAALAAITVFSVFYQQRWGTITDTSWLITVCERVLAGEKLYVDLIETNPPFSVWLYMPPVALAQLLGVAPEILVHGWTYLAAIVGLGFAGVIVRRAGFPEGRALFRLAPVFYALLVIMPGNAFSQREHIAMALFLPLLALTAWRARGEASAAPPAGIAVLAGLCGSVLVLVKPYYALMVLMPALLVVIRQRSLRPLFAPEYWTIGSVCAAYLALVVVFHREFIGDVYPMVAETYVQVRFLPTVLARYALPYAAVMALVWLLSRRRGDQELATVAMLASAAGIVCLVHQGKGFAYHAYPAFLCALAALLCVLALPKTRGDAGRISVRAVLAPVASAAVILFAFTPFRFTTAAGRGARPGGQCGDGPADGRADRHRSGDRASVLAHDRRALGLGLFKRLAGEFGADAGRRRRAAGRAASGDRRRLCGEEARGTRTRRGRTSSSRRTTTYCGRRSWPTATGWRLSSKTIACSPKAGRGAFSSARTTARRAAMADGPAMPQP